MLDLLNHNEVGSVAQGSGVREMLMTAKTEYSKSVTWNQCISPLGLVRENQCLISFMGQLSGSFGLAAAHARLKERFLNSWVQVLFWKTQKTPFLVLQGMRWILCSVAGEIPGNLEFQDGPLDLLCSARLGFQPYPLPGVFNFCYFSVLSVNLSGKIKRTHTTPNCLWLHLCLLFFVSFNNKPLFLFIAPDLHPRKLFLWTISVRFGRVWNFPKVLWNMLHVEHKAHFTIPS